jgi:5-carboxymethyl-2-hydroxymuconate isomerase
MKARETFAPIGPCIVTVDEVPDPYALAMRSRLNGEVVQAGSTAQMRFRIPEIVAYLSRFTELRPGDVIATGTPPGTGIDRQPPRLLRDGDEITIEIDGIGSLGNRVVLNP